MRFERSHTRRAIALAAASSLVLLASACGGGNNTSSNGGGTAGALEGRGPITLASGKDTSGNLQNQLNAWNASHPNEKVDLKELPAEADGQRQQMVQNAQNQSDAYSVLVMDVVWTSEFAANQWITQIPEDKVPDLGKLIPATVETAKYRGKLYGVPITSDGGLLYYRKDLLAKAGVSEPPKTWDDMLADCLKVQALPEAKGMSCYSGQFEKYEGLTVNFSEAINSAGGEVVDKDGKPNVNTPQALAGLEELVNGFKTGAIPKAAITYKEEESRRAFQEGKLLFLRNWPYVYAKASATDVRRRSWASSASPRCRARPARASRRWVATTTRSARSPRTRRPRSTSSTSWPARRDRRRTSRRPRWRRPGPRCTTTPR